MNDPRMLVALLTPRLATADLQARAMVLAERLLQLAPAIGLDKQEDFLDVLHLWLLLAESGPASIYVQGMMRVILSITAWPVAARVRFLRRHLVGRKITPADDELARILLGINEVGVGLEPMT